MYIWNPHVLTDVRSLQRLHSGPRTIDCRGCVHHPNLERFHCRCEASWRMDYETEKLGNIPAGYRQFRYD